MCQKSYFVFLLGWLLSLSATYAQQEINTSSIQDLSLFRSLIKNEVQQALGKDITGIVEVGCYVNAQKKVRIRPIHNPENHNPELTKKVVRLVQESFRKHLHEIPQVPFMEILTISIFHEE